MNRSYKPFWIFGFVILICYSPLLVHGQNVARFKFRPPVIPFDHTEPVLFEALVTGNPTSVVFEYEGIDRAMKDDGTAGDAIPGDEIYTITFQVDEITSKLTDAVVFRPFIGFCKPFQGDSLVQKVNIFAEIWTDEIPMLSVNQLDADFQAGLNIVNIVGQVPLGDFDARLWAQRFYNFFEDDYDFLNFILIPALRVNGYHFAVKNTTQGLGIIQFDRTSEYGSAGTLQGISVFPISQFFDGAKTGYQHDLSHQWINFLRLTPFEFGIPHWPLSDVASGVMGISVGPNKQGGRFPWRLVAEGENYRAFHLGQDYIPVFNDLELYLMGLLPPDSVKSHFVFDNQNQTLAHGDLLFGPVTHISIEDLVAIVGPREPDFNNSQKQFRIATIVISEELLTVKGMSFFNFFALRAELNEEVPFSSGFSQGTAKPFYVSTGGKGELFTVIGNNVLLPPALLFPQNGETGVSLNPTLNWGASEGASSYRLQVSTDFQFSVLILDESITSTSFTVSDLSNNTTYYWRVSATNDKGTSQWSKVLKFTTLVEEGACDALSCTGPAIFPTSENGKLGEIISGLDGDTVFIDIRVKESTQEIDAFGFVVQVDPGKLFFVEALAGDLTTDFVAIDAQENPLGSGTITCGGFGTTPIPANSEGVLIRLTFEVTCAESDTTVVTVANLVDDVAEFLGCCNFLECQPIPNPVSVESTDITEPMEYSLGQNYPNPFNPETDIYYQLPKTEHVTLKIFNTLGQEIRILVNEQKPAGYFSVRWEGKDKNGQQVPSGVYIYQIQAGTFKDVRKILLIH